MAFYTPPALPHELVLSALDLRPKYSMNYTLPSIKHFDMPPHEFEDEEMSEDDEQDLHSAPSPDPTLADWFSSPNRHSSIHIAEKTCEMVCYLWFASNHSTSPRSRRHPNHYSASSHSSAALQFSVAPNFVSFMQKVLETTQVSQSVIVLSLHYIYRLKERNRLTNGESGSEFRVAIAALMMANKFVDDNTYTNKTWSDVSGIPLTEINKMEREILLGIDFSLYVDKTTYESWLNLLRGLVQAKEKDSVQWRQSRSRYHPRGSVPSTNWSSHRSPPVYATPSRASYGSHRARSTSPPAFRYPFTFTTAPPASVYPQSSHTSPTKPAGAKRSAEDAFSPTSVTFPPIKAPRRHTPSLSLSIPPQQEASPAAPRKNPSPMDSLNRFANLSIESAANSPVTVPVSDAEEAFWVSSNRTHVPPKTLSAAWASQDRGKTWAAPQNLYYYTLACSPATQQPPKVYSEEPISVAKKAKLQYTAAPVPAPSPSSSDMVSTIPFDTRAANRLPTVVHSAHTSPSARDAWVGYRNSQYYQHLLPQQTQPVPSAMYVRGYSGNQHGSPANSTPSTVSIPTPEVSIPPTLPHFNEFVSGAGVHAEKPFAPSAPFANAGPPGVLNQTYGYAGVWDYASSAYNAPSHANQYASGAWARQQ